MKIRLNGREWEAPDGSTVSSLLDSLERVGGRVAVERNGEIVPRSEYETTLLIPGDALEVVQFVGGG